jgi:hypothetical protein
VVCCIKSLAGKFLRFREVAFAHLNSGEAIEGGSQSGARRRQDALPYSKAFGVKLFGLAVPRLLTPDCRKIQQGFRQFERIRVRRGAIERYGSLEARFCLTVMPERVLERTQVVQNNRLKRRLRRRGSSRALERFVPEKRRVIEARAPLVESAGFIQSQNVRARTGSGALHQLFESVFRIRVHGSRDFEPQIAVRRGETTRKAAPEQHSNGKRIVHIDP